MCQAPGLRTLTLALNMMLQSQLLPEGLSDWLLGGQERAFFQPKDTVVLTGRRAVSN